MEKTSLDKLSAMTPDIKKRLKSLNIICLEELIAYYEAIGQNTKALAKALSVNQDDIQLMIREAMKIIPKIVLDELVHPGLKYEMPFGALNPEDLPKDSKDE